VLYEFLFLFLGHVLLPPPKNDPSFLCRDEGMLRGTTLLGADELRPAFMRSVTGTPRRGLAAGPRAGLPALRALSQRRAFCFLAAWTRALPVNKGIIYQYAENFNCSEKFPCFSGVSGSSRRAKND